MHIFVTKVNKPLCFKSRFALFCLSCGYEAPNPNKLLQQLISVRERESSYGVYQRTFAWPAYSHMSRHISRKYYV